MNAVERPEPKPRADNARESPWRYPGFSPFVLSQLVSLMGDRISTLAYVTLAASAAGSRGGAVAANVAAIQIAPVFLFSYPGGVLSDRLPRKWLMWWIDVLRCLLVAAFVLVLRTGQGVAPIYLCVLLLGMLSALFNPAKRSFIPFLVPSTLVRRANWWVVVSEVVAMLLGIGLGTLLLRVFSPRLALLFDSFSFLLALGILLWVSGHLDGSSGAPAEGLGSTFREGWDCVVQSAMLRGLFLYLNLPFFLAAGLFYAAANHWAVAQRPDLAGAALGPLLLCLALGALGSFLLRRWVETWGEIRGGALTFGAGAVLILALSTVARRGIVWTGPLVFLVGVAVGLTYARSNYLLHLHTPPEVVGRVMSLREILGGIAFAGSVGVSGFLHAFDARTGWVAAAVVFAAGGAGMGHLARQVRN